MIDYSYPEYVTATGLIRANRRPKMNRVEKLKQMKALVAKKARKEDFLAALKGKRVTPKRKISPAAAKAIAAALSGLLHEK